MPDMRQQKQKIKAVVTRRSQDSQECKDPFQQCFCDLRFLPFDLKINGFPGLIVEHLYVKFGDPSFIIFFGYFAI